MLFYEPFFLASYPAFYAIYLQIDRARLKRWLLLLGSGAFYFWSEPLFVVLLVIFSFLDYKLSFYVTSDKSWKTRRFALLVGIFGNLSILVIYKYFNFFAFNFNAVSSYWAGPLLPLLRIALPIGVSFVVFEKITYLVDCYRGISRPAPRLSDYLLFVFFFPKLLAGPILKYHEMRAQIQAPPRFETSDAFAGFLRFARGMGRKLLIADPLGAAANVVFASDPTHLSAGMAWIGLICFTLQIYFDFAGYSDMAIGLSRTLGFRLRENFNSPYIAQSITEFWQRWHISLTTWIREYLYVPLGGNRNGTLTTYRNLWICFLLSGLWHGASWNFIFWGAYNGFFLSLDRLFLQRWLMRMGPVLAMGVTLFIVMIGWAIFRSETSTHIASFLPVLFGAGDGTSSVTIASDVPYIMAIAIAISLAPSVPTYRRLELTFAASVSLRFLTYTMLLVFLFLAIARAFSVPFEPFIYFRF